VFDIGPSHLLVLAIVGILVLGPEKLPKVARDAARMWRNVRDLATDARAQVVDELGPELADLDPRMLDPRRVKPSSLDPRAAFDQLWNDASAPTVSEPEKVEIA
jgi:sec-independent protein translocase protein TatB